MTIREVRDSNPAGDWVADGGSEGRKDMGEEGGAMNGSTMAGAGTWFSSAGATVPGTTGSGTRTACPILLLFFGCPKHQYRLQQLPHLLFWIQVGNKTDK